MRHGRLDGLTALSSGGLACLCLAAASAALAATGPLVSLPDGTGRELVEQVCSRCHSLEFVVHRRLTRRQWEVLLDTMIARGARISDDEFEVIAAYLSTQLGPLPAEPR